VKQKFKNLIAEYGITAIVLYFVIFLLAFGAFYVAIAAGWTPKSTSGRAGTLVAAYIVTKLTQPFRIAATVLLTPVVARLYERIRGKSSAA
jgi:hypothetical protein